MIFGGCVYVYYFIYGRTALVLDIAYAKEYLWRARASIDLEEQARYMGESLKALEGRRGNPNWLWHLPDTDFDLIKRDLQRNIDMALNISKTESKGSYGYQRAIDNVEEVCVELNEHLDISIRWCTDFQPHVIIQNIIGWAVLIVVLFLALVWS